MPPAEALEPDRIKAGLVTKRIGREVIIFGSLSSTNDKAAEYANDPQNDGLVVLAEEQTQGRGRSGSKWLSGKAESILCSVLLINEKLNNELLSLTAAVATAEAIGPAAKIKWPNDIIIKDRKVAGILLESKRFGNHTASILGVGINCHQREFGSKLKSSATSIDIESGSICDRTLLIKRLLSSTEHWLDAAKANRQGLLEIWRGLSTQLGQRINVIYNNERFTGTCLGVDPEKGLILQLDSGAVQFFPAAQTTITK